MRGPSGEHGSGPHQVLVDSRHGLAAHWDEALFVAFPGDAQHAIIIVKIIDGEHGDLANARTGSVQEFDKGSVAEVYGAGGIVGRDGVNELGDFGNGEHVGQVPSGRGWGHIGGHIRGDQALQECKFVQAPGDDEGPGRGAHSQGFDVPIGVAAAQLGDICLDLTGRDLVEIGHPHGMQPGHVAVQVAAIIA